MTMCVHHYPPLKPTILYGLLGSVPERSPAVHHRLCGPTCDTFLRREGADCRTLRIYLQVQCGKTGTQRCTTSSYCLFGHPNAQNQEPSQDMIDGIHEELIAICQIYACCKFLIDVVSKTKLVKVMIEALYEICPNGMVWFPICSAVSILYNGISNKNDRMRRLLVEYVMVRGGAE
ncbi:hypothetical protein EJ02DRAFT_508661 [Clathrospora elynae]|uniref:Uncharacterized protein n=1 Tax=Clathrospora elynae TaxID=706981 RepID=A0A6A5T2J8_9PLEO|nr:hypothetical protein EJ02DRAFT_508661 [Clathrospora elynae]